MQSQTAAMACSPIGDAQDELDPSQPSYASLRTSDSKTEGDEIFSGFNFALVLPLIKAIKEALKWEEPVASLVKQRKFFKHLGKERSNFLFFAELKDFIVDEWSKVEKINSLSSKLVKLYPFKDEDVKHPEATL